MALFDRLLANEEGAKIIDISHRAFKDFFTVAQTIRFFQEARHRFIEPLILFIVDPDPKSAKAYAMLRRQFSEASLLPVRNRIETSAMLYGGAKANIVPASLDIPIFGFSLRALIDRQSFSFSKFWRGPSADLPAPLDDELYGWVERTFSQLLDIEGWLGCDEPSTRVRALRPSRPRTVRRLSQLDARPLGGVWRDAGSATADRGSIDVPEQVLKFAPPKDWRSDIDPMDQSGNAIIAMIRKAADLSNENYDRARLMANELARQLQAAGDRINQLETEVEYFQNRAVRAEAWLHQIQREIEEKLIAPMAGARPKITP
jgi:hypothetical protein